MLEVGQRIPKIDLFILKENGPETIASEELLRGKRVALFGVPGAYTRTCSASHFPGFLELSDALKAAGVDQIMCLSTNDVFVLDAWARTFPADDKVLMLGDGCLNFTRAAGLETDMNDKGFGPRCRRFSMVVDDGLITHMHLEEPGEFGATSAETLLSDLNEDR